MLGALALTLADRNKTQNVSLLSKSADKDHIAGNFIVRTQQTKPFRWQQIESSSNYRIYISNLRAAGCPEPTIEDIVRGDIARAFSWKRNQLKIVDSGNGPWSRFREEQLLDNLLGRPNESALQKEINLTAKNHPGTSVSAASLARPGNDLPEENPDFAGNNWEDKKIADSTYPFFAQNINWAAVGFSAEEQSIISEVKQQYVDNLNDIGRDNTDRASSETKPRESDPNLDKTSHIHSMPPDDLLRAEMGNDGFERYLQQQYLNWYRQQIPPAGGNVENGSITLNLNQFAPQ